MPEILSKNRHLNETNLILKIDVEGAEWDVLKDIDSNTLESFSQIAIEMHWLDNASRLNEYVKCFKKLSKTHQLVHVHSNNSVGYVIACNRIIPSVIECLLVRWAGCSFKKSNPHDAYLNQPCNIFAKEIPQKDVFVN